MRKSILSDLGKKELEKLPEDKRRIPRGHRDRNPGPVPG